MPIYEYLCQSCRHQFDVMQKIDDEPIKQCPSCFETEVIRLVSAAGFQLKGTGWYATDFKHKGQSGSSTEASSSESVADTKGVKTDSSTANAGVTGSSDSQPSKETSSTPVTTGSDSN